jgi:hypothetical protein
LEASLVDLEHEGARHEPATADLVISPLGREETTE